MLQTKQTHSNLMDHACLEYSANWRNQPPGLSTYLNSKCERKEKSEPSGTPLLSYIKGQGLWVLLQSSYG